MADDDFRHDPEAEEDAGRYRLPFALCKQHGIQSESWWTPRDAWRALKEGAGIEASDEYKKRYADLKKQRAKERRQERKGREKRRAEQRRDPEHNPDRAYEHVEGKIAGAEHGEKMTFAAADGKSVNPFFGTEKIGYRTNCQTCVAAYFARRQGYDVRALPNLDNANIFQLAYNPALAYRTAEGKPPKTEFITSGKWDAALAKRVGEGEIHAFSFQWRGRSGGHIIAVERVNGALRFYDPQTADVYTEKTIRSQLFKGKATRFATIKLSGCTLDENFCDKIMKKVAKNG